MMPVETGAGAYVFNLGAVGVVGTLFGMPIEALILGAVAGVNVRGALIQADEYANITTGGNRNETWSSRFGRGKLAGRKRYVVLAAIVDFFAWVFSGQKNHCVDAINERFMEGQ